MDNEVDFFYGLIQAAGLLCLFFKLYDLSEANFGTPLPGVIVAIILIGFTIWYDWKKKD